MDNITIPSGAAIILDTLCDHGFEAYVVGGCVRDSLLGLEPNDWDICTSATPEEVIEIFSGYRIIETGLKHGTVTLMYGDEPYEVTTFRTDGTYTDGRRPDSVDFVKDICEDLARRDFTMNAMAYNPSTGLVDPFGGQEDIAARCIRCVGCPDDRFREDGLRVMRALRFASVYGFSLSPSTAEAVHHNVRLLKRIAGERINTELCKLLLGDDCLRVLMDYSDVISSFTGLAACVGFEQNNRFHQYTVYDHIAHAVANYTGADIVTKLALLWHDSGKPFHYTEDEKGGHFYGHNRTGTFIAATVMTSLRFDNDTKGDVTELVFAHDEPIEPTTKCIRRWLNRIGAKQLYRLLDLQVADALAHSEGTQEKKLGKCARARAVLDEVLASEQCFSLKHLAINGRDILALGVPEGKQIGAILQMLLGEVIDDCIENERDALLERAKEIIEIHSV
ncbi:MAG: HD domain-containing protein [Clostridia bacterium]|nr:HD domain-containing protein [Clostridia bacterium]